MDDRLRPRVIAELLLGWFEQDAAPSTEALVDVDALVERLEIAVAPFNLGEGAEGALGYLESGEDLIFIREGLSEPIRRFTLAHELGHAVLHRITGAAAERVRMLLGEPSCADEDVSARCGEDELTTSLDMLDGENELLRPGEAYSARSRREREANLFAAVLLMPAERVRAVFLTDAAGGLAMPSEAPLGTNVTARQLATRFGVSEDMALRRLAALLISPEDERLPLEDGAMPGRAPAALDLAQRAAVEVAAPALVVAGPGTGKTSTLVGRIAYLVREREIAPAQVLALTFSNKAAREMQARITALLTQADVPAAPSVLPTVSTIHAFCGDLVRRYAPYVGLRPDFRLVTEPEGYFILRQVTGDLALEHFQPLTAPAQYFPEMLSAISRAKDELAGPEEYMAAAEHLRQIAQSDAEREAAVRTAEVAAIYAAYQHELEERGDPDYGDVIRLAVRLLREQPTVLAEVRGRFAHILVDEFQDINRAMGLLLRVLAGEDGPLWAVGDADQAIYRFRGASLANLDNFEADYPSARICRLERNYRSVPAILEAAAALAGDFLGRGARAPLQATRTKGAEFGALPAVTLATAPDDQRELAGLVREIQARHAAGRAFSDQAILCRTRRHTQQVAATLRAAAIPVRTGTPLLEQDEIKRLLAIPMLLADARGIGWIRAGELSAHPYSRGEARALLREARARGISPLALAAQLPESELPDISAGGARSMARLARIAAQLRQATDVVTGLSRYLFSLTDLGQRALVASNRVEPGGRERARQLGLLLSFARGFDDAMSGRLGSRLGSRSGAAWAEFLDYARVLIALRQAPGEAEGADVAGEMGAVHVLTVHGSKGLEFPVVYLPGMAARRFPMRRMPEPMPLPAALGGESTADDGMRDPHLVEEACLAYVALTRARDELVLSYAERYGRGATMYPPSPFLAPILRCLGESVARVRWEADAPGADLDGEDDEDARKTASSRDTAQPLNLLEIETYLGCPRRYAYQYVDGLRGRVADLTVLRRALRKTLQALRPHAHADGGHSPASSEAEPVSSLEQAHALLERYWIEERGAAPEDVPNEAIHSVLKRHGHRVIEREWLEREAAAARLGAPSIESSMEYDLPVIVPVGEHDVELTVDLIERTVAAENLAHDVETPKESSLSGGLPETTGGPRAPGSRAPIRLVRQRASTREPRSDVRSLLYTLAAEQYAAEGQPVEVVHQHQATGASAPLQVSTRQESRLREELAGAIEGIESGRFPARPEPRTCAGCPFLFICPA